MILFINFYRKCIDYIERIKAKEVISEAFLQVTRIKPDDPIEFLCN